MSLSSRSLIFQVSFYENNKQKFNYWQLDIEELALFNYSPSEIKKEVQNYLRQYLQTQNLFVISYQDKPQVMKIDTKSFQKYLKKSTKVK